MPLLTELVRDVITHPENYTGAFPVSEPVDEPVNSYAQPPRGESLEEFLHRMGQLTRPATEFTGGLPNNPPTATSVMMERERQRNLAQRTGLWSEGNTQFVLDDSVPEGVRFISTPFSRDDLASRLLDRNRSRVAPWGDGDGTLALRTHDEPRRLDYTIHGNRPARPDHYRTRSGQCSCGFVTIWQCDMAAHIDGLDVTDQYGVIRRWMRCECGESRLCREVAAPHRPSMYVRFDPTNGPTVDTVYLCRDCCGRKGISW